MGEMLFCLRHLEISLAAGTSLAGALSIKRMRYQVIERFNNRMIQQWIIDWKTLSTRISIPNSHINQQVCASLEKLNVLLPAILETWTFRNSNLLDIFLQFTKKQYKYYYCYCFHYHY